LGGSREDQVGTLIVSFGLVRPPAGAATSRRSHLSVAMHPPHALKERRNSSFVDPEFLQATSYAPAEKPTNNRRHCTLQWEGARKRGPKPHLGPFVGGSHFTRMHGCGVMFNLKQTTALGGAHRHLIQILGPASCHPNYSPQPNACFRRTTPICWSRISGQTHLEACHSKRSCIAGNVSTKTSTRLRTNN
jgi:hypothetical protein